MLLNLREYHRPATEAPGRALDHALELLARPGVRTVPLAGGDTLLASADPTVEAVVDLQGLDALNFISMDRADMLLGVGAMTTRAALAETLAREEAWSLYQVIAEGARRWGGNIQRNRATVGGAIATAASNDPLLVALLACDAVVTFETSSGTHYLNLVEFLPARAAVLTEPALVVDVFVSRDARVTPPNAEWALTNVARTPADAPIVVAAAMLALDDGHIVHANLALGGVAETPILLREVERALRGQAPGEALFAHAGALAASLVQPIGDFRGTAEYRKAMAGVLAERALRQAWQKANRTED
jgi:carbon-monoxide dehydrogenase medium subunit